MSSSADDTPKRAFRDRTIGRVAMLAVVLGAAFLATKGCASDGPVDYEEAIQIASSVQTFRPDDVQARFFRQGAPNPTPLWAVSFYQGSPLNPTKVQVVTVNARTGEIVDDGT